MAIQLLSGMAFALPFNALTSIFLNWNDDNITTLTVYGVMVGLLPSLVMEGGRLGLHRFAPTLISKVPLPLGILARAICHLAAPFLGFIIYSKISDAFRKELADVSVWVGNKADHLADRALNLFA